MWQLLGSSPMIDEAIIDHCPKQHYAKQAAPYPEPDDQTDTVGRSGSDSVCAPGARRARRVGTKTADRFQWRGVEGSQGAHHSRARVRAVASRDSDAGLVPDAEGSGSDRSLEAGR